MRINRLFYPWCLVICAICSTSFLQNARSLYQYLAPVDSSRWWHFLIYAIALALPVAQWRSSKYISFSLIVPIMCIALEGLRAGIPLPSLRMQTIPADLFGVGGGILLGLNLRTMHRSTQRTNSTNIEATRPPVY